jgi:hypothetical protein
LIGHEEISMKYWELPILSIQVNLNRIERWPNNKVIEIPDVFWV